MDHVTMLSAAAAPPASGPSAIFVASFALYTLFIIAIGVLAARRGSDNNEDYFLAGRGLGPWVAALSASASSESGWVTLGLVGWAFMSGVSAYWIVPGCLVGFAFNWFVLAARMQRRSTELGAVTVPDFFAFHFGEKKPILRLISVGVILVAMGLYVAAQFAAAGEAFAASFGVPYQVGVVLGAVIVLLYTVLGGFRASCWTDFVQGLVMIGTLVLFPIYLLTSHGGFDLVRTQLADHDGGAYMNFWPSATGLALLGFLIGSGAFGINLGYPGQPHVLVRFMALRDAGAARVAGFVSVVWATCVLAGAVTVGLMARAMTQQHVNGEAGREWTAPLAEQLAAGAENAGETGLVLAAQHMIPGVLSGMVLAAVLAAICSTADSQLVVAASSWANDVYFRIFHRSKRIGHLLVNRIVIFLLGLGAVLLVIDQDIRVFEYVLDYGWAVLGASFGPQLILALLWRRASYAGCVAGMITGFLVAIVWKLAMDNAIGDIEVYNLSLGFVCAMIVNVVVSLAAPDRTAA